MTTAAAHGVCGHANQPTTQQQQHQLIAINSIETQTSSDILTEMLLKV